MKIDDRFLIGAFVVVLGVILLLGAIGVLSWGSLARIWRLWPLALIFIGLGILQREGKIKPLNSTTVLIILAIVLVLLLWGGPTRDRIAPTEEYSKDLPTGIKEADFEVSIGAGELDISATSDKLYEGEFRKARSVIDYDYRNGRAEVEIKQRREDRMKGIDWDLKLIDDAPLKLELNSGAGNMNLDFSSLKLTKFRLSTGASSITVIFGDKVEKTEAVIKSGASSIKVIVPKGLGVHLKRSSALGSLDLPSSFEKINGREYKTDNYDEASAKLDLEVTSGVGSLDIRYK